jgi:uncharacterized OB-fold protein
VPLSGFPPAGFCPRANENTEPTEAQAIATLTSASIIRFAFILIGLPFIQTT